MVSVRDCSDSVLGSFISPRALEAGALYQRQGRVRDVLVTDDGTKITAKVQGNEKQPYVQAITIKSNSEGKPIVYGLCSCPVGNNCKHVAAAVLGARDTIPAQRMARTPTHSIPHPATLSATAVTLAPARTASPEHETQLGYDVQSWLEKLAEASADDDYPAATGLRVLYILSPAKPRRPDDLTRNLELGIVKAMLRKNGEFSDVRTLDLTTVSYSSHNRPKFLRNSDQDISERLRLLGYNYMSAQKYKFEVPVAMEVLKCVVETGRAHWLNEMGPVLSWGGTRKGRIVWRLGADDKLRSAIEIEAENEATAAEHGGQRHAGGDPIVLAARPPVWVDPAAGLIGPTDTGFRPAVALAALAAPPVAPKQAMQVAADFERQLPKVRHLAPPIPDAGRLVETVPKPRLRLEALRPAPAGAAPVGIGRLFFDYDDIELSAAQTGERTTLLRRGAAVTVVRDPACEAEAMHHLDALDLDDAAALFPSAGLLSRAAVAPAEGDLGWLDFLWSDRRVLEEAGWTIEIAPDFPVRLSVPDGGIEAEIREGSGIDWLELDLGVMLDGIRIDLVPALAAFVLSPNFEEVLALADEAAGTPLYLPLADGRVVALPPERIRPILAVLSGLLLHQGEGRPRLSPADGAALDALEQAGVVFTGGEKLRHLGRMLSDAGGIPDVAPPPWFTAELRPYQRLGLSWLQLLGQAGLGGILADDMGLGKTVQTLAHIAAEKAAGRLDRPALIVGPTSLVANWTREAARFAPELNVLVLHGLDRHKNFGAVAGADLVVTTYPLIVRDAEMLEQQEWHMIVLDEAQAIKNPRAVVAQVVRRLTARQRLCLSGTPMENHLGELWSLFDFVIPGFLGSSKTFNHIYRAAIEKKGDRTRADVLARRVRPFMLRRTKEEVAKDLPPKNEMTEPIELGEAQRDVYETIRATMHDKVRRAIAAKGLANSHIIILDALLKLRQAVCDPRLLKGRSAALRAAGSAKLERLTEMLRELVAEGRRILVFSQFTSMLALIEDRLQTEDIDYCLLTGDTTDRPSVIARFQDGHVPVFLVSLKAGGVGLNLTAADTVVLYDPWWNPAVEDQAVDRAHRIGQTKPVFVHRLVAIGTIEEKMETLKQRKRALAEGLFDADGAPTMAMTPDDIEELFS